METGPEEQRAGAPDGEVEAWIWLAADDLALRRMLAEAIAREGFRVLDMEAGATLEAALEQAFGARVTSARPRPAALVFEARGPGASSLEPLARLRALGSALPVFLVGAHPSPGLLARAAALGVRATFERPFTPRALLETLRTLAPAPRPPRQEFAAR